MVRIIGNLNRVSRRQTGARRPTMRKLAVMAILMLLVGALAPTWALAAEPDSEGEGSAPAGLEDPHFEPGGEEAALEVLPGPAESGGSDVEVEDPPIETEPPQEPELPESAPSAEEVVPPVGSEPEPPPPPAEAPAPATPEYAPAVPEYVAPSPSSTAPVENEPIVAPSGSEPAPKTEAPPPVPQSSAGAPEAVVESPSPSVVPSEEQEAPPAGAPPPAPAPAAGAGSGGVSPPLRGRSSYTVRAGDCLWSIAEAVLPSGAGNDEIAAEVARLWRLNANRIGSGDPNVILIGTELRLH